MQDIVKGEGADRDGLAGVYPARRHLPHRSPGDVSVLPYQEHRVRFFTRQLPCMTTDH
jgi:hypothetical protein